MSSTLTWLKATAAKTNTTNAALITDMVSAVGALASGAKWQVAASSTAGPLYVVLKPKSGAAGRLLFVIWASAPAGNNAAILQAAPTTNTLYCAWFPAGNVDSPSNLTASSGTILGDDTGAVKVCCGAAVASIYAASIVPYVFDSGDDAGGCLFIFNNPASTTTFIIGGGKLVVDSADAVYDCVIGAGTVSWAAVTGSDPFTFQALSTTINAGATTNPCIRTNYGATDDLFFTAWVPKAWGTQTGATSDDPMTDTSVNKVWFSPYQLAARRKGVGFALKLRQIAFGPPSASAFNSYSTTGPVVAAIQMCATTAGPGANACPYVTNFKI